MPSYSDFAGASQLKCQILTSCLHWKAKTQSLQLCCTEERQSVETVLLKKARRDWEVSPKYSRSSGSMHSYGAQTLDSAAAFPTRPMLLTPRPSHALFLT